jgi:hypothetical protein
MALLLDKFIPAGTPIPLTGYFAVIYSGNTEVVSALVQRFVVDIVSAASCLEAAAQSAQYDTFFFIYRYSRAKGYIQAMVNSNFTSPLSCSIARLLIQAIRNSESGSLVRRISALLIDGSVIPLGQHMNSIMNSPNVELNDAVTYITMQLIGAGDYTLNLPFDVLLHVMGRPIPGLYIEEPSSDDSEAASSN